MFVGAENIKPSARVYVLNHFREEIRELTLAAMVSIPRPRLSKGYAMPMSLTFHPQLL